MEHHKVPTCPRCRTAAVAAAIAPYPPESQVSFGVVWRCRSCAWTHLDIGMIGPLVPSPETCLNCGAPTGSTVESACAACGWRSAESAAPATAESRLASAREAADGGFYNRAFHHANAALLADPALLEAWRFKAALLLKAGLPKVRERMLAAALRAGAPAALRAEMGEAVDDASATPARKPWWRFW